MDDALRLNEAARKENILIVLKPHFSQDISRVKKLNLTNICFINDTFFNKHQISSYSFVGGCDALVTDYSSIYFDFLLCNKPIASIWEDVNEYRVNRGFAFDIDYYMKGAYKIFTIDDFINFIYEISSNVDSLKSEREEIMKIAHHYLDDKSTERVVDFIENNCLN